MSTLAVSTLLALLDSIAQGVVCFEAGVGVLGTEANTVAKGAANNVATLAAIADLQVQTDLAERFTARAAAVKAGALYGVLGGAALQRALDQHYGTVGGLNRTLATADVRVHPNLRKIGFQVDAPNVFCPTVVDPMATFVVTGSGAGTFTAGTDIDRSLYGKANLQLKTVGAIGLVTIVATLTLKTLAGLTAQQVVTIPAGSGDATVIAIGTPGTDLYMGVQLITITGGTVGDTFKVISAVERAIVL